MTYAAQRPRGGPARGRAPRGSAPSIIAPAPVLFSTATPIEQTAGLAVHIRAKLPAHYTPGASQRVAAAGGLFFQSDPDRQPGVWSKAGGPGWPGLVCGFPRRFYDAEGTFIRQTWIPGERYLEAADLVIDWTQPWTVYAVCFAGETSDDVLQVSPDIAQPNGQSRWQFRVQVEGRGNGAVYVNGQETAGVVGYGDGVVTNPAMRTLEYHTRQRFGFAVCYGAPGLSLYNHHNTLVDERGDFSLAPFVDGSRLRLLNGGLSAEGLVLHELVLVAGAVHDLATRADILGQLRVIWGISA